MNLQTVSHVLKQNHLHSSHFVSTFSSLDAVLGGGIPCGFITQIAGESGIGKTQLCFQLCLNVQIPSCSDGIDGEAVYLDTENTFQTSRLFEMAEALIHHQQSVSPEIFGKLTSKKLLSGIYMFRCVDIVQLLAASHQMFEFIKQHSKVKLIIVDSVAHCIRHEEDSKARMKFLNTLADNFRKLALHYNIAVVTVNQVTTRFKKDGSAVTIPALGQTWSYVPSVKLMLKKCNDQRYVLVYKSPSRPRGAVRFVVDSSGFRGHPLDRAPDTLFLTQNITNDLLLNDFEPTDDDKTIGKQTENFPEELLEKWLLLSQRQLKDINDEIIKCDENFDEIVPDITEELRFSESVVAFQRPDNATATSDSEILHESKEENCLDRSQSPILSSRPIKKKRKIQ